MSSEIISQMSVQKFVTLQQYLTLGAGKLLQVRGSILRHMEKIQCAPTLPGALSWVGAHGNVPC